jgi:hypothetical protein
MAGTLATVQHELDAGADLRHRKVLKKARLATSAHVLQARRRKIRVKAARIGGVNQNQLLQTIQAISNRMHRLDAQMKQQGKCLCFATLWVSNLNPFCYSRPELC